MISRVAVGIAEAEYVVKRSRFIARAGGVSLKTDIKYFLQKCKEDYPNANHHCWAYLINKEVSINAAMSDDGEPSGTAGKPILNVLRHKHVDNVMVVVVRYFGGVKLGAGGLIRAYSSATQKVMEKLKIRDHVPLDHLRIFVDFAEEGQLRYRVLSCNGIIDSVNYTDRVICDVSIPCGEVAGFQELAAAKDWIIQALP